MTTDTIHEIKGRTMGSAACCVVVGDGELLVVRGTCDSFSGAANIRDALVPRGSCAGDSD